MKAIADYQTPDRMSTKLSAIPLPDLKGKRVLDVGCDERFWCDLAWQRGARRVLGVDRGRRAHDGQWINCADYTMDVGRQWHELGKFDVILCFSLYHHIYQSAGGDHRPIWFWLWRQLDKGGVLLWENPVDTNDTVVRANVSAEYHHNYHRDAILSTANRYFNIEYIGPAQHVPTREVYRFTRKPQLADVYDVVPREGTGGATKAFLYDDSRRLHELHHPFNIKCFPGSLNLVADRPFDWEHSYYRTQISDVKDRSAGLASEWTPRWLRFYPVTIVGEKAWAFRFEGEKYSEHFVELVSNLRLRDFVKNEQTELSVG